MAVGFLYMFASLVVWAVMDHDADNPIAGDDIAEGT